MRIRRTPAEPAIHSNLKPAIGVLPMQDRAEHAGISGAACSGERVHLERGGLAVDGLPCLFDRAFEGLPTVANILFVGVDCADRRHQEGVRLKAHVGSEFALALGGARHPDRSVKVFVAGVICRLGCRITGLADRAGIELASAVRRADVGADDALQVDLHGAFLQPFRERGSRLGDEIGIGLTDTVAVEKGKAEAL
jgi:hypothetical protein